jgi:hypothetical protein
LSPHIPFDETNERSAHSILLLHSKWGPLGDLGLLEGYTSAVARFNEVKLFMPVYVRNCLSARKLSESLLATTGFPDHEPVRSAEDFDNYMANYNDGLMAALNLDDGIISEELPKNHSQITLNVAASQYKFLSEFIENTKRDFKSNKTSTVTLTPDEQKKLFQDPLSHFDIPNVELVREELDVDIAQLNFKQREAFDIAVEHISGRANKQMIMFLSGEGGTGKSKIIHSLVKYTRCLFGKTEGSWGAVCVTAPTGGSAHNIHGNTWHSALGKSRKPVLSGDILSDYLTDSLTNKAKGTVLFILDEVSLVCCEDLFAISERLCNATGNKTKFFGGLHVILAGDFYQMKTMGSTPLVQPTSAYSSIEAATGRKIFTEALTHYILLTENCRAMSVGGKLSPLASFCRSARIGNVGISVLAPMNKRILNTPEEAMLHSNPKALWITSTHDHIFRINKLFLTKFLSDPENPRVKFRIIAHHIPVGLSAIWPDEAKRDELYNVSGSINGSRHEEMMPQIDLVIGSRVRIIRNLCLEIGLFNGAMGTVYGFVYQGRGPAQSVPGEPPRKYCTLTEEEREIPIVLVQMDGSDETFPYSCSRSIPRLVPIISIASSAEIICGGYRRMMVPILPAHARTGHSVQGYTGYYGVVVYPGSKFFAGDYVAISRAKDIDEIILMDALQDIYFRRDIPYKKLVDIEYERLLAKFPQNAIEQF